MPTLAELIVRIGADVTGFENGMKQVNRKAKRLGSELTSIGTSLTVGVTAPLVGISAAAIKAAGDFEQTNIAFTTMLGSAEKATGFLKELEDFAKGTPFEFTGLTNASKRLLAMGFAAEQVIPTMTAVGNAVAALGGGDALIDRVTLALGQMQAKGKVSAEEMKQLTEAGIPAWEILAETIGTDVPEAMAAVQKRAVDSETAIAGLMEGLATRFGGLMEKQSQTLLGKLSNLKDEFGFIIRDFGVALIPAATAALEALRPVFEVVGDLARAFAEMDPGLQGAIIVFGLVAAAIGPVIAGIGLLVGALATIGAPTAAAIAAVGGLGAAVAGLGTFVASDDSLKGPWEEMWDSVKATTADLTKEVAEVVGEFAALLNEIVESDFGKSVIEAWKFIWETIKNALQFVLDALVAILRGSFDVMEGTFKILRGAITGDWELMAEGLKTIWEGLWTAIKGIFTGAKNFVINTVGDFRDSVVRLFTEMSDEVVGNSIVPDMMEDIQTEFKRLDSTAMLDPVKVATANVGGEFSTLATDLTGPGGTVPMIGSKIEGVFGDVASGLTGLFTGEGSIADVGKRAFETIKNSVLDLASDAVMGLLKGQLTDIVGLFGKLGLPGGGGLPGTGVPGTGGGGTGGVPGGFNPFDIAGIISSIIGNFQNARMETTLNAIELNTRKTSRAIIGGEGAGPGVIGLQWKAILAMSDQLANLQFLTANTDQMKADLGFQTAKLDSWHSDITLLSEILSAIRDLKSEVRGLASGETTLVVDGDQFGRAISGSVFRHASARSGVI